MDAGGKRQDTEGEEERKSEWIMGRKRTLSAAVSEVTRSTVLIHTVPTQSLLPAHMK